MHYCQKCRKKSLYDIRAPSSSLHHHHHHHHVPVLECIHEVNENKNFRVSCHEVNENKNFRVSCLKLQRVNSIINDNLIVVADRYGSCQLSEENKYYIPNMSIRSLPNVHHCTFLLHYLWNLTPMIQRFRC